MALSNENSVKKQSDQGSESSPAKLEGLLDLLSELMGDVSSSTPAPASTSPPPPFNDQAMSSGTSEDKPSRRVLRDLSWEDPPTQAPAPVEEEDELAALQQRLLALSQETVSSSPPAPSEVAPAPAPSASESEVKTPAREKLRDLLSREDVAAPAVSESSSPAVAEPDLLDLLFRGEQASPAPAVSESSSPAVAEPDLVDLFSTAAALVPSELALPPEASANLKGELLNLVSQSNPTVPGTLSNTNGATFDLPASSVEEIASDDVSGDAIEALQSILVTPEVKKFRQLNAILEEKLKILETQIYDPQSLIQLLLPWIAEILNLKILESKEEVVKVLVPIIDEVIKGKSNQDRKAMSEAIANLLPEAIAHEIENSPKTIAKAIGPEIGAAIREQIRLDRDEIAQALAPEMGRAIKEQISIERDAMVDALYPVIGSTVARYIAEALQDINQKIQNALSWQGVQRKIRAKVQGVSEGELVFKDAIPFAVQAIFLIHKGSGLVISDLQPNDASQLESEMVAGMLTAIRSFVNDCIAQAGENAELDVVEYGASRIMIEVAGYCYLAVVMKGEPSKLFIRKVRDTLGTIVLKYGKSIEQFEGDQDTIPHAVQSLLVSIIESENKKEQKAPLAIIGLCALVFLGIMMTFGITSYRYTMNRRLENKATQALNTTPELAVYGLTATADKSTKTVQLTGNVPSQPLRETAEKVVQEVAPDVVIDNQIIAVDIPPDPTKIEADVVRLTTTLNQMKGVAIATAYAERKVNVTGTVRDMKDAETITAALEKVPGVQSVVSTIKLDPLTLETRIYFDAGSVLVQPSYQKTFQQIQQFLAQHPEQHLKVIGHTDPRGRQAVNQKIAEQRAEAVKNALVLAGVDPKRLHIEGRNEPPKDVESGQPLLLSRCVIFELFQPTAGNPDPKSPERKP